MKIGVLVVVSFVLYSCSELSEPNNIGSKLQKDKVVNSDDWSNPAIIQGTSFGEIINTAYRVGDSELLIKLTDSISKNTLSDSEILELYKGLQLGFEMKLISIDKSSIDPVLHYEINVNATIQVLKMPVIVEDDTVRLNLIPFTNEVELINR